MRIAVSPARSRTHARSRRGVLLLAAGIVLALAATAVGMAYLRRANAPVVLAVDPPIGDPGGFVRIVGRNFGDERGDSFVLFDQAAPTASSYASWSDTLIEVRVPHYADSSLVRVRTPSGRSNARMFMSRALLPSRPAGAAANAVAPVIDAISSDSGAIGSTLVIRGLNFGSNREGSEVLFTWNGAVSPGGAESPSGGLIGPNAADGEYLLWSDKEIKVCVPDGAVTGGLLVRTARGSSAIRYFQIEAGPGTKAFTGGRTYALSTFVTISRVRASGPNALFLWMPFPEASAAQRGVKILGRSHEPYVPDFRGLSVYRLQDLESDKLVTVSQDCLVEVHGVDTEIKAERVTLPPADLPAAYAAYTAPDALVRSDAEPVKAFAKKAVGKERNPYRNAKALLDALAAAVRFEPDTVTDSPDTVLARGRADAWDLALTYAALLRASGIPALPVTGVVVDDTRSARRHAWVEFYLYGFGWVPVDPVLYSGASLGAFESAFEDPKRYFGDMDDRHIAFTRGFVPVAPNTPDAKTVTAARRYSMQSIFEESSGAITAYTSFWSDVEVTGVY